MRRALIAAVALPLLAVACRSPGVTILRGPELPSDIYGPPAPTPTAGPNLPDTGDVWLVKNGRLKEVRNRPLQGVATSQAEALMLALLGPPELPGVTTEIPQATRLNSLEVGPGVATVDLSENFERGSDESLKLRLAQVVYTLTEDPRVQAVEFSFDGEPESVIGAAGTTILGSVERSDYRSLTRPPPKG
jgi:sporulation and spore germination protein